MSEVNVPDTVPTSPETAGSSPGAILRRCREFHGFTLEEASETTKIGISYLKALESDQIHEFANQAYLKGFLRIYATYLGLNSDDVARMYGKLFGAQDDKSAPARAPASPIRQPRRLISIKKLLFPAFLLAMILITATFFNRPPPPLVRQQLPAAVVVSPPPVTAVQAVQSSVRVKKEEANIPVPKAEVRPPEPPVYEEPVVSVRPAEAAKGFILKIKVTQSGTLTSTVDNSGPQQYDLEVGDVIEWKAEKKVTLELSNAGGVNVELNGKPYKSLGPPGKPAYVELDAAGVAE
jgi:cytoskeleton protein RodZ